MAFLIAISLVFTALGIMRPRWSTVLVPIIAYLGFAWLESIGWLPGITSMDSALLAGGIGAVFAAAGVVLGQTLRANGAGQTSD